MNSKPHLVQYKIFEPHKNLFAFTTTKNTLAIDKVRFSDVSENKVKLAETLRVEAANLIFPKQTHTNSVVELSGIPEESIDDTDALVTNRPGLCICVQTADCVPILLFDPIEKVISAVHAGWRGTVGKIVEVAVSKMVSNSNCKSENIIAAIGPSISPEIYEVGDEVVQAVLKSIPNAELTLWQNKTGKFHFDLWEANRQLLLVCGLNSNNIETLAECSFQNKKKYYSARREGIETGRIVSGIMLKL